MKFSGIKEYANSRGLAYSTVMQCAEMEHFRQLR